MKKYDEGKLIVKVIQQMLGSTKQNFQSMGVQILSNLYRENQVDLMFKHLMVALSKSKYETVRKKIIKCLRVPMGISNEVQSIIKRFVGARLTDSDPGVRIEAFEKIAAFQIKIEDFDSPEIRMRIIKEGMSDQDENVLKSCLNFLTPSIIQTINIEVTENEVSEMLSQGKPSISKN